MKFGKILLMLLCVVASFALVACDATGESTEETSSFDSSKSINVYTRDTTSGTREGFFAAIGASNAKSSNEYLVDSASEVDGNGDMINKVAGDEYGIGYISLTSLASASGVTGLTFEDVEATEANVLNGTYGMSRTFSYVTIDDTQDDDLSLLVAEFNKFLTSIEGQAILVEAGVILEQDSTTSYQPGAVCSKSGVTATVEIGGSTSVESAAKALTSSLSSKCSNFSYNHAHSGSGDSEKVVTDSTSMQIGFSSAGQRSGWTVDGTNVVIGDLGEDAIVVVVNEANTLITNITAMQLQEVYVKVGAEKDGTAVGSNTTNATLWANLV